MAGIPQHQLERAAELVHTIASRIQAVEGSLDATREFVDTVAEKLRSPQTGPDATPYLMKEVITSDPFQRLAVQVLAQGLRRRKTAPAHRAGTAILCNEPDRVRDSVIRREVPAVKPTAPDPGFFIWWIIIIIVVIIIFFWFFLFPLGGETSE